MVHAGPGHNHKVLGIRQGSDESVNRRPSQIVLTKDGAWHTQKTKSGASGGRVDKPVASLHSMPIGTQKESPHEQARVHLASGLTCPFVSERAGMSLPCGVWVGELDKGDLSTQNLNRTSEGGA